MTMDQDYALETAAATLVERPFENTVALIAISAAMFYKAEVGHNPGVNDYWDALVYCSTCVSVGYAGIFPRTPVGKIIGSILMTVGPALSAKALSGPPREDPVQAEVLSTLKQILAELKARK